jgi:hypothetical protein
MGEIHRRSVAAASLSAGVLPLALGDPKQHPEAGCPRLTAGLHVSGRPGALRRPGPPQNRTCTFQCIRLKQGLKVGCRLGPRSVLGEEAGSPAGPLTPAAMTSVSSLSVGWGVVVIFVFGLHLTTSARFRVRASGSVSGRLSTIISRRALINRSSFPAAFRRPAFASWSSCSRQGVELPSRSADRQRPKGRERTPTGFPRFARSRRDRGGRPL